MGRWRREQISLLLTAVAILLWTHSILCARLEIGYFGLIHGLPVTFFVALALLTVASAILYLLEKPEVASRIGESGYRTFMENYTPDAVIPRIIEVYESLI